MLSVFVPVRGLWVYYDLMILLRLYLSGIAFFCLCFYTEKKIGQYAVMAGALSDVFCYRAILNANRHPYFLIPCCIFPSLSWALERFCGRGSAGKNAPVMGNYAQEAAYAKDAAEQAASLAKAGLENVRIGTDTIRGTISLDKPRILCFSVPYSVGWAAIRRSAA